MTRINEFGQPIGDPVPDWHGAPYPDAEVLPGRTCSVRHIDPERHGQALFEAFSTFPDDSAWTYLTFGPFPTPSSSIEWAEAAAQSRDPRRYVVAEGATGRALGTMSLMRIDRANGVVEVGAVAFAPALQRTTMATEAHYLLMRHAFDDLGYRRLEWKCDDLNQPSRAAALRLGYRYEGTFRHAIVYKGRSRDTAWYAMTADEWPAVRARFEAWLDPANFDAEGRQLTPLRTR